MMASDLGISSSRSGPHSSGRFENDRVFADDLGPFDWAVDSAGEAKGFEAAA
jgi:hypothetical protein